MDLKKEKISSLRLTCNEATKNMYKLSIKLGVYWISYGVGMFAPRTMLR